MDLSKLIEEQVDRDRRRGFRVDFELDSEREDQLMRDLIGLVGEVGEFSNLLKKVMLTRTVAGYDGPDLASAGPELREELADAVIYIFRIATVLGANLEEDIKEKISKNDGRYQRLEK